MLTGIRRAIGTVLLTGCCLTSNARTAEVTLYCDSNSPQAAFAAGDVQQALAGRGYQVQRLDLVALDRATAGSAIVLSPRSHAAALRHLQSQGGRAVGDLQPEGFSLRTSAAGDCWVVGADEAGVMYGGLELAEQIRLAGIEGVEEGDRSPYLTLRGTKFNIPLDARTPTYTDPCDAAQKNIAEMWNLEFWKEYIDRLARHRYNFVSLWNLHPFPSLVRVPEYPDVALADVKRSTTEWEEFYSLNGTGFDAPQIVGQLETLKTMTIEEKIEFWREVMRYGRTRNVAFAIVTWNIFVNGTDGKYGITDRITNPVTVDYFRRSVRQLLLTYPDLAGVGLTTGENMPRASVADKEAWALATYGQGVLEAADAQPGRKILLIHRQHQAGARAIAERFQPLIEHPGVEFVFSFKYAQAHVYSSTRQTFHESFVQDIAPLKTLWTLRNDDNYHFRWAAPDFVREFLGNLPLPVSRGFYFGSDQWVWGREFLSTEPESPRQLELAKHDMHWMLWGRLGYDLNFSNERIIAILQQRFPQVDANLLFTAWQEASLIYPATTGFHWGALDFQWYIEACKSHPNAAQTASGFHDVNRFITLAPHPGTDNVSIPEFVDQTVAGEKIVGTSPLEVSRQLHRHADRALEILPALSPGADKELRLTLGDIRAMAHLGKYYAFKIRGATELALFRETGREQHQQAAVEELTRAADSWRQYVAAARAQYDNPVWTNRVGHVDWTRLTPEVLHDIRIAAEAGRQATGPQRQGAVRP